MNREQIDRAEKVAELVAQERLLKQFRRMDVHDEIRKHAERLIANEWVEAKGVSERMRYYDDHARRMEMNRLKFIADMMADGVIPDTPANRAAEFYHRPEGNRKRVPNTRKTFTDKQMEIAMRSVQNPVYTVKWSNEWVS